VCFSEGRSQGVNRLWVARWLDGPGWHLGLIGHEEGVQMAGDEARAGWLFDDDVDDILAVPAPGFAEEGLLAIVVEIRSILKVPVETAIGLARQRWGERPAGAALTSSSL
jgi:hypothetical protein